jgi:putative RNA 2'-phosphotransferase
VLARVLLPIKRFDPHAAHERRHVLAAHGVALGTQELLEQPAAREPALMHQQGFKFFRAENGVWLSEKVPASFIAK